MSNIYYVRQQSVFSSDNSAGRVWREEKHVNWLYEAGHNVSWISSDFDHYGKVKRKIALEERGFFVKLLPTLSYKKNVSMLRLISNWEFAIKLFIYMSFRRKKIQKIFCAYPTPESVLICVLFSKITKTPLIVDMRDNWPEAILAVSEKSVVAKLFIAYCAVINKIIFKLHDVYIGMSDGVLAKLHSLEDCNSKFLLTLPNTINKNLFENEEKFYELDPNKVYVSFFGTINSQFCFDIFFESLNELGEAYPNLVFLVVGGGENYELLKKDFSEFENVEFLGRVGYGEVLSIANQSSGFFCFYSQVSAFESHFTNKLIEYMFFGKPFLHNLDSTFYSNRKKINVGYSLRDMTLVCFVEKFIMNKDDSGDHAKVNCLPDEFNETQARLKFLELFD